MTTPLLLLLSLVPAASGAAPPAPSPAAESARSPVDALPDRTVAVAPTEHVPGAMPDDSAAWAPPSRVAERVREEIGHRWGVEPGSVRLEWGPVRPEWRDVRVADFRLLGSGSGGSWVVAFLDPDGQRRFAVRLTAGVRVERAVAARALDRGDTLRTDDLRREERVARGRPPEPDSVRPGWVARRTVRAGEPLRPPAVTPPAAVESGGAVKALLRRGSVEIAVPGTASGRAALGETVRVWLETGRRVRGVAVADGVVRIERPGGRR